ncbi:MAG TPA: hypothetical protein VKS25_08480 [Solirubrobacteraceae bacterium]|nr:hypothetical protein [Solirubrobacteraceae bacterium]
MRRASLALAAAAALLASGCETTQEQSAKIGRALGHQSAATGTLRVGGANRSVRVLRSVLVGAAGQSAVAVELSNTGARPQASFPILIAVRDAHGKTVYRNDTEGIEPSLQSLSLLPAHASEWWVDNEVLGGAPKSVSVSVGASSGRVAVGGPPPLITTRALSASASFPGPHVSATVSNRSAVAQRQLALYAVVLNGNTVVGAGRAIVVALGAHASTSVVIPVIGSVDGRTISVTTAPGQLH